MLTNSSTFHLYMGDKCAMFSLSPSGKHMGYPVTTIFFQDATIGELGRFLSSFFKQSEIVVFLRLGNLPLYFTVVCYFHPNLILANEFFAFHTEGTVYLIRYS